MVTGNGYIGGRVWRFADCEYDELKRRLWVRGKPVELQYIPLEALLALLSASGHTLTNDQIIGQVWAGEADDSSVRVAINRLRDAFGDPDRGSIIHTIPRVGYKIAVPVHVRQVTESFENDLNLCAGDFVSGYEDWKLLRPLDPRKPHQVWLAEHRTTRETHVFKFAVEGIGLQALQREKTVYQAISRTLDDTRAFVRVFGWRFTSKPFFTETEYAGLNLTDWADGQRNSGGLSRRACLDLMADLAEAVAAAHQIGIIHNDLKPSNILILPFAQEPGRWQVKVADFGVASLTDSRRFAELDLTVQAFSADGQRPSPVGGTALYLAPEVRSGQAPSTKADIFALGVILFQLLCGDFREPPVPGWEARIDDALLRQDIAEAANLDPALRLDSAGDLARRLRTLEERREQLLQAESERRSQLESLERAQRERQEALRQLAADRARRPWIVAAMAVLVAGLCASLLFYFEARRQQEITARINAFLNDDLLAQSDPKSGNPAVETLRQAVLQAAGDIDREFPDNPTIAAHLHDTVANALNNLSDYADAATEFDAAARRWIEAEGPLSTHAIADQYKHVTMDSRSIEPHSIATAKALLAQQEALFVRIRRPTPSLLVSRLSAQGTLALASADTKAALQDFREAEKIAAASPKIPQPVRLTTEQRLCFIELKAGEANHAESCARELMLQVHQLRGPDANTNLVEMVLMEALLLEGKNHEAINEANQLYPKITASLGPDNNLTLQVLATRATAEAKLEMWPQTIHDMLAVSGAARKRDPDGLMAIGGLSDAALSECRSGGSAGEIHARQALAEASKPGINPGLQGGTAYNVVSCILDPHEAGKLSPTRLTEAEMLLKHINVPAVDAIAADPRWGANVTLAEAQIAFARKQFVQATELLRQAASGFESSGADPYQKIQVELLTESLARRGH